jgi:hypothetical protein
MGGTICNLKGRKIDVEFVRVTRRLKLVVHSAEKLGAGTFKTLFSVERKDVDGRPYEFNVEFEFEVHDCAVEGSNLSASLEGCQAFLECQWSTQPSSL